MSQSQNSLFRQQQRLYRSSIYLSKTKVPTYSPPLEPPAHDNQGRKRRASFEDEEMTQSEPLTTGQDLFHLTKRNRTIAKKGLPIGKLLATLEKEKLIELINDLVDSNPHLKAELASFP